MENSFLRYLSLILLFITIAADEDEKSTSTLFSAIYYGDTQVNTGEPFSITCIISISDPIQWMKDGETIKKHNLRHGRDDHAFVVEESGIEGERDKIEATISVKKALTIHEGKYQCNSLHPNYHYLKVHRVERHVTTPQQNLNFVNMRPSYNPEIQGVINAIDDSKNDFNMENYDNRVQTHYSTTQMPQVNQNYNSKKMQEYYGRGSSPTFDNLDEITTVGMDDFQTTYNEDRPDRRNRGRKVQIMPNITSSYDINSDEIFREYTREYPPTSTSYPTQRGKQHYKSTTRPYIPSGLPDTSPPPPKHRIREELVPNYDLPEHEMKIFNFKTPIVLNCNITSGSEGKELKWLKDGVDVTKIESMKKPDYYKIYKDEQKFVILKGDYSDAGQYSCVLEEKSARRNFTVVAHPYVKLPANTAVVEGEKLSLHCNAYGTNLDIVWTIGNNLTIKETTGRYILKDDNNVTNARLEIETVIPEDRGEYTCNVTNPVLIYQSKPPLSDTTLVRVKGKLAALWPFLGICAEVFILCGIILIYEKRRNKSELEESDTDPNTEQKKKRRSYD